MTQKSNLSAGREYLAIPGPSVIPDAVLQAMHRAAPNIYAGALPDMMPGLVADLRRVARTRHHVAIYIGNGHAAWEAALANVIGAGDRVLVPATGSFGHDWGDMAAGLGAEVETLDFGKASAMDMARIGEALKADRSHAIKAVLAVHVDTSSSVRNDIAALRAVMDEAGHPALLMVDCIASLGCDVFEMDDWGVDVMVTACQKGLMVPPGMAFVFFNDKAGEVRRQMPRVSRYWDWTPRAAPDLFYQYWNGTAPTHHVYGLRAALDMIHAEGIEAVWRRHEVLAHAIWAACSAWGAGGSLAFNVAEPDARSRAVTSLKLESPQATALRDWTENQLGLTLGIGLGMATRGDPAWHGFFRLGHMGHINGHMIMGMLGGVDAGLKALDIPHGPGALEAASTVIATGQLSAGASE
ncbi:aminotransferase class V-fold PLP-dependent enzyme [Roseobacter denitrificans]|uniref:Serine--glyoxylate aminotransferase, putative n=1 Tax=Roseobacter denitrificans (strain ATCC 33942 / OCh 114) TaxID=375451 RepID=Q169H2_ROSDO|nr:aminotransferase class V-fold PLP-dependent enzyme [Roseobacter denitrificans]ABG31371.1 serine--glyoxylate aminotransferase, putative [Roseobacter denitrificans OCh 114]AVL54395.1 aminotransferase class V-fold PLP-dependent enzyme [Roseobacter denitrificans]SFG00179.1 alanine-glyoxylate transaminase / serine-glyoxylate transaminase / serine-pyruvate transaminase [Roseobacter denitrificans OCh 114]